MDLRDKEIKEKINKTIKPWGEFTKYALNENCTVKILTVYPKQMLSKQIHSYRDELWIILDEGLKVEVNNKIYYPKPNDEIIITRNAEHRLSSIVEKGRVLEVAFGNYDESDIKRIDDIYKRK